VIPGRIRYPSDNKNSSDPSSTDVRIAASLLNGKRFTEGSASMRRTPLGSIASRRTDQTCLESSSPQAYCGAEAIRTRRFLDRYSEVAKEHGLEELSVLAQSFDDTDTNDHTPKHNTRNWFRQRLARKNSLINLISHRSQPDPTITSLEDTCRLGGVSILQLPPQYAPTRLAIPTCLAATANHLVKHGTYLRIRM